MPEQLALYNGSLPADLLRIQIPDKFHPTGSYNHADKSGQLPKTEPLRCLLYTSYTVEDGERVIDNMSEK